MAFVILLGVAIIDREWVNYKLKLLEQSLDLAAEAGGQDHQLHAKIQVTRRQFRIVKEKVCEETDANKVCTKWKEVQKILGPFFDYTVIEDRQRELEGVKWKDKIKCDPTPMEPQWECTEVKILERRLTFRPQAEQYAVDTLRANWRDHPSAKLINWYSSQYPMGSQLEPAGVSQVTATIRLRMLFGLAPWTADKLIQGGAVVKVKEMELIL